MTPAKRHVVLCRWDEGLSRLFAARVEVHLILDERDRSAGGNALGASFASVYYVSHFDRADELAAVAVDLQLRAVPVHQIVSFQESTQYGASVLRALLGLAGPTVAEAAVVRDKRLMKARLAAAKVPTSRFVSLGQGDVMEAMPSVIDEVGLPCVVKPVAGMGCVATTVVGTAQELETGLRTAHAATGGHVMVEEYVTGPEFHVDAIWRHGEPWVFVVSKYIVPVIEVVQAGRNNGSFVLHEPDEPAVYAELRHLHHRVNRALGIVNGPTHTEFLRSDRGFLFSEMGARIGGAAVAESVGAHLGVAIRELFAAESLGDTRPTLPEPTKGTVGWCTLAPAQTGRLKNVAAIAQQLRQREDVLFVRQVVADGQFVNPLQDPPNVKILFAVLWAEDARAFTEKVARIEKEYLIEVESEPDAGAAL